MGRDKYFQDYSRYYWSWEDDRAVATVGDMTVAYTDQLKEIINGLCDQGLPPFGSLLIVLAATLLEERDDYRNLKVKLAGVNQIESQPSLDRVFDLINTIGSLEGSYKRGKRRILLLQTLFQGAHNLINFRESKYIASVFSKKGLEGLPQTNFKVDNKKLFTREIRILDLINRKFPDVQSIKSAMANLPEVEEEYFELESEEITHSDNPFIDQLISNNNTSKIGLLIERIWSSANIPMHHRIPSGQPFGGVADITNKGSFDKLLTSEFANEDVTLLSRLANNEAMFFHREAPPSDNNQKRVILLDVSLKNWGTSRTVAFAIMLAIYHHPKSKYTCSCFGVGTRVYDYDVSDIDGVIEAIQNLDTSLSSVKGLSAFFEEHKLDDCEVFFISNKESSHLNEIKLLLAENNNPIDYWIHPSKEGDIDIFKKFRTGKKHHQSFKIPLEKLWNKKRKPLEGQVKNTDEPEQIRLEVPLDILLPSPANYKHLLVSGPDAFKITNDGYLYKNVVSEANHLRKGWELIYSDLPEIHAQFAIGREPENGNWMLISYSRISNEFNILDIENKENKRVNSPLQKSTKLITLLYHNYEFFTSDDDNWFVFDKVGELNKVEEELKIFELLKIEESQQESYKVLSKKHLHSDTIFKNFEKVSIDHTGQLTINKTRLHLNTQHHLVIKQLKSNPRVNIKAENTEEGIFVFPDGSKLIIHVGGLISLISSNPEIPHIKMISMIHMKLGVLVDKKYAGDDKFYKLSSNLWKKVEQMSRSSEGSDNKVSFAETKEDVAMGPGNILVNQYKQLEKTTMEKMYNSYIKKYINHIVQHGS